ncbi:copper chaperone PCu(A)C [Coralloluteibacterium thermophilus]|uniref:Copper chaperone PCu(A)C n=1 Tax=Coralloluteibacterium thermophilum TaxID=2707049 RepID=A0ABV9NP77_9GAMM
MHLRPFLAFPALLALAACDRTPSADPDRAPDPQAAAPAPALQEGCVLHLVDGWLAPAPPVAPVRAGYLTIHNAGSEPVEIEGVSSPAFARVELHATEESGGVSRMRRLDAIEVAPGEALELAPGGLHLMLMDPVEDGLPGTVEVVVHACGEDWAAPLPQREDAGDAGSAHRHHGH